MSRAASSSNPARARSRARRQPFLPDSVAAVLSRRLRELGGLALFAVAGFLAAALVSYSPSDPSWNRAGETGPVANWLGVIGSYPADLLIQTLGIAAFVLALAPAVWGWRLLTARPVGAFWIRLAGLLTATPVIAALVAPLAAPVAWTGLHSSGGALGAILMGWIAEQAMPFFGWVHLGWLSLALAPVAISLLLVALGVGLDEWRRLLGVIGRHAARVARWTARHGWRLSRIAFAHLWRWGSMGVAALRRRLAERRGDAVAERPSGPRHAPTFAGFQAAEPAAAAPAPEPARRAQPAEIAEPARPLPPRRPRKEAARQRFESPPDLDYELPALDLLAAPDASQRPQAMNPEQLQRNAELLEGVLADFGVRGEIVRVNPGPVVTLYELEPAPGTKSSRVIGLADDIARSMSAISVRVAVVPGRNAIGIEMPNAKREIVLLRELLETAAYERSGMKLALVLGKDIGGEPMMADLARMPHLLVAGTTGSGKSVAINTMILSLLYRLPPERCRFIMVDPKMLELSVYDGIPHLLAPVVTDPRQAVVALKWTVREMEDRYRAMSKLGVRNIDGYNQRLREAKAKGESLTRRVQTGFDPDTGKPVFEEQPIDLTELPFIVVIVDEMADLMLVAGKEIEAAIQRLAQMARAAGIHLIMATQRPSVDVITGTIKANFPTRISFQVTSKIDSRTILGEGGAEQLLGQGDMLFMAGGGRITRVHGPFVADREVEMVVAHLKTQGEPDYNDSVLEDEEENAAISAMLGGGASGGGSGNELYDQAVALVTRERRASTSFIQRHLQIGYNRAARIIEQMESEGVVSRANHVGKREVLVGDHSE